MIKEYELEPPVFYKWVRQIRTSVSFEEKDNRTPEQEELIRLRKENQKLAMENDILKQAALIMGRKVDVIRNNRHKYSVSAMCDVLQIPRSWARSLGWWLRDHGHSRKYWRPPKRNLRIKRKAKFYNLCSFFKCKHK
ncbi:hypothetical protein SAMN05216352_101455 [Alteribacillus bidgolensis]|uniref:Transposase n=1 Tax=Alteribacillus bidgolensis TaxID=930129 RepID=A0A1G8CV30_9BACI|nr:hypothetical protein SAMN05216352_101455 [Alteribacillus bidgolensis]